MALLQYQFDLGRCVLSPSSMWYMVLFSQYVFTAMLVTLFQGWHAAPTYTAMRDFIVTHKHAMKAVMSMQMIKHSGTAANQSPLEFWLKFAIPVSGEI